MRKTLSISLIILLLSTIFVFYFEKNSEASYSSKFANYPGYEELIEHLQKEYPNWEFEIYETGLDWSDVLEAETVARHGRSLISKKVLYGIVQLVEVNSMNLVGIVLL